MTMFAGFNWPKQVWNLPTGNLDLRKTAVKTGLLNYYRCLAVNPTTMAFPTEGPDAPDLDWQYADEHLSGRKRAYKADDWSGIEFRGVVMVLPNRRGYIAGWTDGQYTTVDYDIYDTIYDASVAADDLARSACEREIEFQQQLEWEMEQDEAEEL